MLWLLLYKKVGALHWEFWNYVYIIDEFNLMRLKEALQKGSAGCDKAESCGDPRNVCSDQSAADFY